VPVASYLSHRTVRHSAIRTLCVGQLDLSAGEFGAGEGDELLVGVGVPPDTPAAVVGLGEDRPGSLCESGVACGVRDDVGQFR